MTHANSAKNTSISAAVVQAIAAHTGTRPEDLPEPLAAVIDPDALDHLFRGRDTKGQVQFVYQGLRVTAEADGTVTVRLPATVPSPCGTSRKTTVSCSPASSVTSCSRSTVTFGRFAEHKHDEGKEVRQWVSTHIMCGVNSNIVTGAELGIGYKGDAPNFKPLLEKTARQFNVEMVAADGAYSSREIHTLVDELGAEAYIPFDDNATGTSKGARAWRRMYHKFQYESHEFWPEYKKRNNVESTFHMIKSKFDEDVRSKKERAQINEVLLKILCHNITVLIHETHEHGIEAEF